MSQTTISVPLRAGRADAVLARRSALLPKLRQLLGQPWIASVAIFLVFVGVWQVLTTVGGGLGPTVDPEYAKLMGQAATGSASSGTSIPSPVAVAERAVELGARAFDASNPNNLGIAWHLYYSLGRVFLGYVLAVLVAVPLGFGIGLMPRFYRALNPFIQVLKPISPLAWMPLALYTLKDSAMAAIFIIFICSLWPLLINTAAGAAGVRQDWLNVSRVLGLKTSTKIMRIVFPASVPMILTGMRISIGIAWFVIVAAEMVVGQDGIGYFIWNEWNNLQISSMIVAILLIGLTGLLLDQVLARVADALSFKE
ncbi:MAG: ABC transporter permease [Xanthobacteraceae bacterium]|nr:ABC transporter permease [Xanthobacteraceae bacterium]